MSPRTTFLSRLIGLYFLLVGLSLISHKQAFLEMVTAYFHDAALVFIVGVIAVVAGLAIILQHNVWSGSAVAVVVTLVGWVSLIKGLLFLFLPPGAAPRVFLGAYHFDQLFDVYATISILLGTWMAYAGFTSHRVG